MDQPDYVVVRCPNCGQCCGFYRKIRIRICPRCEIQLTDSVEVVTYASNAESLSRAVSLANIPPPLRKEFKDIVEKCVADSSNSTEARMPTGVEMLSLLDSEASEEKIVTFTKIEKTVAKQDWTISTAELFALAEKEGLLLRIGNGTWRLLT